MNAVTDRMADWKIQVPGKWILAGEHAVLRGSPAIVFPLKAKYLNLYYSKSTSKDFEIKISGTSSAEIELIIWSVFEKALAELKTKRSDITGLLTIESHIQFGAGMGASATLAVGVTLFLKYLGFDISDTFIFAKKIEDLFHGESSGVDVAVALHQKAMVFQKNTENKFFDLPKLPRMYLSYTGQRGVTKDCVNQVKKFLNDYPEQANSVDVNMKNAVEKMISLNFNMNLAQWKEVLDQAQSCFEMWNLVPASVQQHIDLLKKAGAISCKMTGSGFGGYVLSLWDHKPDLTKLTFEMIAVGSDSESIK